MNVRLNRHSEELLREQMAQGDFRSPEEVLERALAVLAEKSLAQSSTNGEKTPLDAVEDIFELRKGVRLGGISLKSLIHEGHRI